MKNDVSETACRSPNNRLQRAMKHKVPMSHARRLAAEPERYALRMQLRLIATMCVLAMASNVYADCSELFPESPTAVVTPNGAQLAFAYDLLQHEYSVTASRTGDSYVYQGLRLQADCQPGGVRWESDDFVLLESGCGGFCWVIEALGTTAQRRFSIPYGIDFDAQRNLVVSYQGEAIGILSLTTGYEQRIPTQRRCRNSSDVCYSVRIGRDALAYTWEDGREVSISLDERLFH
jgi:hypothetical protein